MIGLIASYDKDACTSNTLQKYRQFNEWQKAKGHGGGSCNKLVAVCPLEHELAWSEDQKSWFEYAQEAQQEAVTKNAKMTLFNTNLVFGPETLFLHYLAQCSLVGKVGYANLAPKDHLNFRFNPVSSEDIATAVDFALDGDSKGRFNLAGPE